MNKKNRFFSLLLSLGKRANAFSAWIQLKNYLQKPLVISTYAKQGQSSTVLLSLLDINQLL